MIEKMDNPQAPATAGDAALPVEVVQHLRDKIASGLHYPDCWDTAAYPTLEHAMWESLHNFMCSTCLDKLGPTQAAAPQDSGDERTRFVVWHKGKFGWYGEDVDTCKERFSVWQAALASIAGTPQEEEQPAEERAVIAPVIIDRTHSNQAYVTLGFDDEKQCTAFLKASTACFISHPPHRQARP
jgi:hypothetical protein